MSKHEILRDRDGRFAGQGAKPLQIDLPERAYLDPEEAGDRLRADLPSMIAGLLARDYVGCVATQGVPAAVVAASPGAGKSRIAREVLVGDLRDERVDFYAPTLALAAEASNHSAELGAKVALIRGRSALGDDGMPLCRKSKLVEKAARLGIPIMSSFCRNEAEDGTELLCEHYQDCAYIAQREAGGTARQRYMATSRMSLDFYESPTSGDGESTDDAALTVVDETFWRGQIRVTDVKLSAFILPRIHMPSSRISNGRSGIDDLHADLLADAHKLVGCLTQRRNPMDLAFTIEHLRRNAKSEWLALSPDAGIAPDQVTSHQSSLIDRAEQNARYVASFSKVWSVLADARERERSDCERLQLAERAGEPTIRTYSLAKLPRKAPYLVLDADADPEILSALGLAVRDESRLDLRPNAHVIQVHDRSMSTTALKTTRGLRDDWRAIIAREVLADQQQAGAGVLVGASRGVVKAFFEDAGYDFSGMSDSDASRLMLETELLGARWLWFGSRSLGLNTYRGFGTVVVIGREELPVAALESQGRALFGDRTDTDLYFVEPDAQGNLILPMVDIPYEMSAKACVTHGETWVASVPCHPDPLIRRIQLQTRELATRQLVERLRLAHAETPRRVILGSRIPIPGLPVDELVSWDDFKPTRAEVLFLSALRETGGIRASARGFFEDAAGSFSSLDSAKKAFDRMDFRADLLRSRTAELLGERLKVVEIHQEKPRARNQEAFLIADCGEEALQRAGAIWGPMRSMRAV
ncbi:MAG: hypothetical protein KDK53_16780 [Maritimibacter sp.]|nr:hypothetical protein [Maritimibacter sp.]